MGNRWTHAHLLPLLSLGIFGVSCEGASPEEVQELCAAAGEEPTFESHGLCSDDRLCNGIEWCDPTHPSRDARNCVSTDPCHTLFLQRQLNDDDVVASRDCTEPRASVQGEPFRACRIPRECEEEHCWDRDEGLLVDGVVLVPPVEQKEDVLDHVDGFRYDIGCLRAVCTQGICGNTCVDDGKFCNGTERCVALMGCERGGNPCDDLSAPANAEDGYYECLEEAERCDWVCDDLDGDGVSDRACGGQDCDDQDAGRYFGNPEVCDAEGVDEDCDEETVGDKDDDGDGYIDSVCFNEIDGEVTARGTDCDDTKAGVNPGQSEVCNGLDDDCDGDVDEDVRVELFTDEDGDGFGVPGSNVQGCPGMGLSFIAGDCDDTNPHMFPGAIFCDDSGNSQLPTYQFCKADGTFGKGACNLLCTEQPSGVGVCD